MAEKSCRGVGLSVLFFASSKILHKCIVWTILLLAEELGLVTRHATLRPSLSLLRYTPLHLHSLLSTDDGRVTLVATHFYTRHSRK